MRLMLVGSPRSGNNWVRRTLAETFDIPPLAEHRLEDFPPELPENCILNIHRPRDVDFISYVKEHNLKVVVIGRSPLDIFLSVLQFSRGVPEVHRWLDGECHIPENTARLRPEDPEFIDFMLSDGAVKLLSVTLSWWRAPELLGRVKYEEVLESPRDAFERLISVIGLPRRNDLETAISRYSVAYFAQYRNHGWLGEKDIYKSFLTRKTCERVYARHSEYFRTLGYTIEPDKHLSRRQANDNYERSLPALS